MDPHLSLTTIANDEGTDKGTIGPTEAWPGHHYTDVYSAYLEAWREAPVTLLEIGLGVDGPAWPAAIATGRNARGGASARMWYRYLRRARILGVDVNPAGFLDNDRICTGVADQGDPEQLRRFLDAAGVSRIDFVVDDGSHRPDHQQISLSTLFPYLSPGGIYFIEDLLDNGFGDPQSGPAPPAAVSTRRLLAEFSRGGRFPEPHALVGDGWAADVASITFHCPPVEAAPASRSRRVAWRGRGEPDRDTAAAAPIRFALGSERLCAIRKTGRFEPGHSAPDGRRPRG
ncbi:MAG TPA: class I SAM-dependent methyltransferase [Acidimicrobiales bacterium]|nr:class I SAM-dependent methyltransferase [Acidimicrobiales bacterium]